MVSPDVYPRLNACYAWPQSPACAQNCDSSAQNVNSNLITNVGGLIDQIQGRENPPVAGVAKRLAQAFINLYQREIEYYKSLNPPNQQMINQLQQSIQQLQQVQ